MLRAHRSLAVGPRTSRKHILDAIDGSLRRLDTDYVDLYQLHGFDPSTPVDETLGALDDVVRSGKARYVGVSNWLAFRLARALGRSEVARVVRFDRCNPGTTCSSGSLSATCFPLPRRGDRRDPVQSARGGLLTGKHHRGGPTEGTRFTLGTAGRNLPAALLARPRVRNGRAPGGHRGKAGVSLTTLAVAWVLANPAITSPIVGASRPEQLEDSVRAVETTIDDGLLTELEELTAPYRKGDADR